MKNYSLLGRMTWYTATTEVFRVAIMKTGYRLQLPDGLHDPHPADQTRISRHIRGNDRGQSSLCPLDHPASVAAAEFAWNSDLALACMHTRMSALDAVDGAPTGI